jgi:molybdate transport system ATP-binding protein
MSLHVDCRYATRQGFKLDVTFDADEGITALCGPSGAGKTTVLHLVAGLIHPDEGQVILDGRPLVSRTATEERFVAPEDRGVAIVFQDNLLFPHLSVEANLRYGLARQPTQPLDFERVVSVLELGDLVRRYPDTLSGGQQRRVAIGRALLRGPSVLLLDEPWTGLDEVLKRKVTTLLLRCREEWSIPLLLASHDTEQVQAIGAQRLGIAHGRLHGPQGA